MALRVILLSGASYDVEHLLHNFYNLVHLCYLRIRSHPLNKSRFPNKISRFYQIMVLDAEQCDIIDLPSGMNNLAKLRHFLVKNGTTHSSIVEVGKLKSLQELKSFVVKEGQGFELRQIGHLEEICGSLCIGNLENVKTKEEADEAKLVQKSRLHELIFCWNMDESATHDSTLEEHVLERLKPSSNLLKLSIKGHRGTTCPSWLGANLSVRSLESLYLKGVAWKKFPSIGELRDLPSEKNISCSISDTKFGNLRRLKLCKLTMVEWVVHAPCQLLPLLEVLIIKDCPQLKKLSFEHFPCCQRLVGLEIRNCPQLWSFPPVPWTETPCSINIEGTGISCLGKLVCGITNNYGYDICSENNGYGLQIKGHKTDSKFWDVLAFHNLTRLEKLDFLSYKFPSLRDLQMLSSLKTLVMSSPSNAFPFVEADSQVKYQFPVESLEIKGWNASGKDLTQLLTYMPKLSDLLLYRCGNLTGLAVNVKGCKRQQQDARAEDEISVASEEAVASHARGTPSLLLLPPQLQELRIVYCSELSLHRSNPYDDSNKEDGGTGGGGLQGLTSLRGLKIWECPKLLSSYSSPSLSSSFPFPNSLEYLDIKGVEGMDTMVSLSHLTSLTSLFINYCEDLRGDALLPLLTQGHLTKLSVREMPKFHDDSEQPQVHEQEIPSCLQELEIDDVAGFTAASIRRSLIFSSLTKLEIEDYDLERFTKQQEALLIVNSLKVIIFRLCDNLKSLPEQLPRLPNLKRLQFWSCKAIQMLPNDGLPSSLEELEIISCPEIQSLPKGCLPDSLQKLEIKYCPAIRSLPEVDDLPSSLLILDVPDSESEELRSHCRKLINIIPIVRLD